MAATCHTRGSVGTTNSTRSFATHVYVEMTVLPDDVGAYVGNGVDVVGCGVVGERVGDVGADLGRGVSHDGVERDGVGDVSQQGRRAAAGHARRMRSTCSWMSTNTATYESFVANQSSTRAQSRAPGAARTDPAVWR